jgi:transposase InsO family protein
LCELLEIRKTRTSPNNPKANGQMERFNRTLLAMIKSYLRGEQTNWDLNLGCLVGAYRATPNESTGLAPNLLLFGREIRMPYEIVKERISFGLEENSKNWG